MSERLAVSEIVAGLMELRDSVGLPLEPFSSYPVPVVREGQVCLEFFFLPWAGAPPDPPVLYPPMARMMVDLTGRIVRVGATRPADYGLEMDPGAPLGERDFEPPLGPDEYEALVAAMHGSLDQILDLVGTLPAEVAAARRPAIAAWKQAFDRIVHQPALPFYRATNPRFFEWVDAHAGG